MANIICGEYLRNYAAKTRNQRLICVSHLISTFIFQIAPLSSASFPPWWLSRHSIIKHLTKEHGDTNYPRSTTTSLVICALRRWIPNTQQWLFLGSLIETFEDLASPRPLWCDSLANPLFALSFNFESRQGLQKYFSALHFLPTFSLPLSCHIVKRSADGASGGLAGEWTEATITVVYH